MCEERQNEYGQIWPTLIAIGACCIVALVVVIDILGMVAQR